MEGSKQFEVEVKTLLGSEKNVQAFLTKLRQADQNLSELRTSDQLNHYFKPGGDTLKLAASLRPHLSDEDFASLSQMLADYKSFALRTRLQNGTVLLVVKAASGDEDDQHALSRAEGEYEVALDSIEALDELIVEAGFDYLSKWSRHREEYRYKDYTVCIDRNAGYGYLAEIEQLVDSETEASEARQAILAELTSLDLEELSQERLGRMFAHYNKHWPEYYQTDKTFTVT